MEYGLWRAHDAEALETILRALPLHASSNVETTPLSQHPSDPKS